MVSLLEDYKPETREEEREWPNLRYIQGIHLKSEKENLQSE